MAELRDMVVLVLLGLVMMFFAYYAAFIGFGFQMLVGGIGAIFIVAGILGIFGFVSTGS